MMLFIVLLVLLIAGIGGFIALLLSLDTNPPLTLADIDE